MSEVVNHEEAYLLACAKESESNLARCYLDIKAQRDELLEALEDIFAKTDDMLSEWLCEYQIRDVRKAIAKAKGE